MINIRCKNKKDIIRDPTGIKKIVREHYANKLHNLYKMDKFLENPQIKTNMRWMENLKNPKSFE